MFTGIIERIGTAVGVERAPRGGARLALKAAGLGRLRPGASLAVDGVCLTVKSARAGRFAFDLSPETLRRTTLGRLRPGDRVNCEKPLRHGDPLGGHLVSGHVDGIGRVAKARREGSGMWIEISAPRGFERWLLPKGSVAVDGVSLTVARLRGRSFAAALIPVTLRKTNLSRKSVGDAVNLEGDLYLKWLAARGGKGKK